MEQDDPDGTFGPMKLGDVVTNFVPYAPIKVGSAYYKKPTSEQAFPVYVENVIVHATYSFLRCLSSPTFFSYEPRTARKSCSCSLERAAIFTSALPCHGMLVTATG